MNGRLNKINRLTPFTPLRKLRTGFGKLRANGFNQRLSISLGHDKPPNPWGNLPHCAARYTSAQGLLLDAYVEGIHGGTGASFDWALIPNDLPLPVILSGGLDPQNVVAAIQQVQPYAVDVSSGVEVAKGV